MTIDFTNTFQETELEADTSVNLPDGMGFYLDVFETPKVDASRLLPIATRVRYTHEAAVFRYDKGWYAVDPKIDRLSIMGLNPPYAAEWEKFLKIRVKGVNKSVIVWPSIGESFVFGFVRRGVGESSPPSGGSDLFGEYFEPGYFSANTYVPLYVLKSQLQGTGYFYAPIQAVSPV